MINLLSQPNVPMVKFTCPNCKRVQAISPDTLTTKPALNIITCHEDDGGCGRETVAHVEVEVITHITLYPNLSTRET